MLVKIAASQSSFKHLRQPAPLNRKTWLCHFHVIDQFGIQTALAPQILPSSGELTYAFWQVEGTGLTLFP